MRVEPLKIGVVGAGGIAQAHRVAFEQLSGEVTLAGVADPNRAVAEQLAGAFGAPAFGRHKELFEQVKPDAVLINTPHHLHYPIAAEALTMGIPAKSCVVTTGKSGRSTGHGVPGAPPCARTD